MRPIRALHQIEMTSHCNLRCDYCPSPNLQRPKVHMDQSTFEKCLSQVRRIMDYPGNQQAELNLAGIGESTIHPEFLELVTLARNKLGYGLPFVLATNGITMTEGLAEALALLKVRVWVSLHKPRKAKHAVDMLSDHGALWGVSIDPSVNPINWAGQVEGPLAPMNPEEVCPWLSYGRVMCMADGRVTTCCIDASGAGVIGTIDDDLLTMSVKPYSLCPKCYHPLPEDMKECSA